ncbi:ABC transporter permease [Microbacterium rhizomatis]|uniref:ABC transporter permease n=1 Tax=Microbacterium rhizomatis TaxID=1631477 RepID=UPI001FE762D6|nr:FtsX-like permease family protein [Microbacterium rhizomatis]
MASAITVLVLVGMVLTVMLTTGRTVGAEQRVLGTIDDAGTRAIQVRAEGDAGLTAEVLDRIARIEGIEWAAAFSAATDATNTAVPDGRRVPSRLAYGTDLERIGVPGAPALSGTAAYASPRALDQLGLPDVAGSVTTTAGIDYAVVGRVATPEFLSGLEPLLIVPQAEANSAAPVTLMVVIAQRPDLVTPVSAAVLSVLAVDDPAKISVQTSEALAQLRTLVQSQLETFSRGLVLVMLAATAVFVSVILYGLVMMRRKDFGRRRALGASRGLIIALLLTQTTVLAAIGIAVGLTASVIALLATRDPLPGFGFTAGLTLLALFSAVLAALLPAVIASRREPIRELRVP